ncbi:MAG: HAMP domain-containing protein [Deltaproteobacteria bacterium]|nr:HAMP domain-containing protein [Deltaproteobacteria bacterium]
MRRFSLSSLRARLLLLVLLAVLPALGLILYTDLEQRRLTATQAQEDALRLARLAAADQTQLIQGAHQFLTALAQLPAVREGDAHTCTTLFTTLLKQYPVYANLGAAHANGAVFCSVAPLTQPVSVAGSAWFQRALQRRDFIIGEYQRSLVISKFTLVLGYPVLDAEGQVQAVIAAALDLSRLNQIAAQAHLPSGATLIAVDRNGTIIARYPDPEIWVGKVLPEIPIIKAMLTQGEGTAEIPGVDGNRYLYAFTQVGGAPEIGMYVSIGIPTQVAFAVANQHLVRNLTALGVVTLLILGAAWIGSDLLVLRRVNALVSATQLLRAGDLSARTGLPHGSGELDHLAGAFDDMAEALERRAAEHQHAEETLQVLSRQLLEAQENERRHIARELHDEIGQALTAIKINLQAAQRTPDALVSYLEDTTSIVDRTLQQVRALSLDLRPALLDDLGLGAALRWYGDRQAQRAGFTVQVVVDPLEPRPRPELETACFRVAQEALTNVMRHAQAQHVRVELRQSGTELHLLIRDDGKGFDVQTAQEQAEQGASTGLLGMQERVWLVGGHMTIESAPAQGTEIRVRFPLQHNHHPSSIHLRTEPTKAAD